MKQYEFDGIGTHWWIEILDDSRNFTADLVAKLQHTIKQFDRRYSRFYDDSLVAKLYQYGHLPHPPTETIRILEFAREVYRISGGAFDCTVGNDFHRLGYGKRSIARSIDTSKFWNEIIITPAEIILPIRCMLDFGGFGKGWLIEQFERDLRLAGVKEFIVNGGGDLYVQSNNPIKFQLEDPYDSTISMGSVDIKRGALAGSSTVKRVWNDGDLLRHHIIDPKTHIPSQSGVVATFVVADSALLADAAATILILRPELVKELSAKYHLKAMIIPG